MNSPYDTEVWAEHRRPLDRLERKLVNRSLTVTDPDALRRLEQLRYALSFARLTAVRNPDGGDVDLIGPMAAHTGIVRAMLEPRVLGTTGLNDALTVAPELVQRTLDTRASVLARLGVDRVSLEREVTTRQLVVASGGGGGAGYVFPGAYDVLDRAGIEPALMLGTSIGALMSMFRCRRRRFDLAALIAAARVLKWGRIFRVLEADSRYGLPATLRLYLRSALGSLFETDDRAMWLSDMEIPLYVVVSGITVDALKHDLNYYETLIADDVRTTTTMRARSGIKAMAMLREFLTNRSALRQIVLGRDPGTEDFDTLDAAGFSAAIPGIIHYDVVRHEPRMARILDRLYAVHGITRLGEGGMVSNVPARVGWESAMAGELGGHRNVFVLSLDCFSPSRSRLRWFPFQQMVRQANVAADLVFTDRYVPFDKTLSPLNLVPALPEAMLAIRWGREAMSEHMPFLREMLRPIEVLRERDAVIG